MKLLFFVHSGLKRREHWQPAWLQPHIAIPTDCIWAHIPLQAKPASVREIQGKRGAYVFLTLMRRNWH